MLTSLKDLKTLKFKTHMWHIAQQGIGDQESALISKSISYRENREKILRDSIKVGKKSCSKDPNMIENKKESIPNKQKNETTGEGKGQQLEGMLQVRRRTDQKINFMMQLKNDHIHRKSSAEERPKIKSSEFLASRKLDSEQPTYSQKAQKNSESKLKEQQERENEQKSAMRQSKSPIKQQIDLNSHFLMGNLQKQSRLKRNYLPLSNSEEINKKKSFDSQTHLYNSPFNESKFRKRSADALRNNTFGEAVKDCSSYEHQNAKLREQQKHQKHSRWREDNIDEKSQESEDDAEEKKKIINSGVGMFGPKSIMMIQEKVRETQNLINKIKLNKYDEDILFSPNSSQQQKSVKLNKDRKESSTEKAEEDDENITLKKKEERQKEYTQNQQFKRIQKENSPGSSEAKKIKNNKSLVKDFQSGNFVLPHNTYENSKEKLDGFESTQLNSPVAEAINKDDKKPKQNLQEYLIGLNDISQLKLVEDGWADDDLFDVLATFKEQEEAKKLKQISPSSSYAGFHTLKSKKSFQGLSIQKNTINSSSSHPICNTPIGNQPQKAFHNQNNKRNKNNNHSLDFDKNKIDPSNLLNSLKTNLTSISGTLQIGQINMKDLKEIKRVVELANLLRKDLNSQQIEAIDKLAKIIPTTIQKVEKVNRQEDSPKRNNHNTNTNTNSNSNNYDNNSRKGTFQMSYAYPQLNLKSNNNEGGGGGGVTQKDSSNTSEKKNKIKCRSAKSYIEEGMGNNHFYSSQNYFNSNFPQTPINPNREGSPLKRKEMAIFQQPTPKSVSEKDQKGKLRAKSFLDVVNSKFTGSKLSGGKPMYNVEKQNQLKMLIEKQAKVSIPSTDKLSQLLQQEENNNNQDQNLSNKNFNSSQILFKEKDGKSKLEQILKLVKDKDCSNLPQYNSKENGHKHMDLNRIQRTSYSYIHQKKSQLTNKNSIAAVEGEDEIGNCDDGTNKNLYDNSLKSQFSSQPIL